MRSLRMWLKKYKKYSDPAFLQPWATAKEVAERREEMEVGS